ncbi:MAG: hypothetical protein PVSMB7_22270 [Chloroflexota bacterium]
MNSGSLHRGDLAPEFDVRLLTGGHTALTEWRGRRLLLLFVQPHCRFSRQMLRTLAGVQRDGIEDGAEPVVVSYGRHRDNEPLQRECQIQAPWLLQDDIEVAQRYGLRATPGFCTIDEEGRVTGAPGVGLQATMGRFGVSVLRRQPGEASASEGVKDSTRYVPVNESLQAQLRDFEESGRNSDLSAMIQRGREELEVRRPLVSVIMTTRDRPSFLPIALECYRRQSYEPRELLVIDDGTRWPADREAVEAVGGRIIRVDEGTTLGAKLNRGCSDARGDLCQKWDDDDWYGPRFLERLVTAQAGCVASSGGSAIAYLTLPLLFDLPRWRLLKWRDDDPCGATLLFERQCWEESPFEDIRTWDDFWFLVTQFQSGVAPVSVPCGQLYAILRHDTLRVGNGHSWRSWGGESMDAYLQRWRGHILDPASVLPDWALAAYRTVRETGVNGDQPLKRCNLSARAESQA